MAVPAILLIVLSFAVIVALMRFKLPLWLALLGGSIFVIAAGRVPLDVVTGQLSATVKDGEVISLGIIIVLILLFSDALRFGGRLDRMVDAFRLLGPGAKMRLASFPALIGLLPMPGGAVFSAPMVEAAGKELAHGPGQWSAINYWFRHIWEYWWPLYPGVLLAVALGGISIGIWTLAMLPFTIAAAWIGAVTQFREVSPGAGIDKTNFARFMARPAGSTRRLLRELSPILLIVIGGVGFELFRDYLAKHGTEMYQPLPRTAIMIAIVIATIFTIIKDKIKFWPLIKDWASWRNAEMVLMIILVVYYKNIMETAGLIDKTVSELTGWNIPVWGVALILPFLLGLITGIQFAAVGVSFPVVAGLGAAAGIPMVAILAFAYVAAFMGTMTSPVHFCFLLTKEYFHDGFGVVYKRIYIPIIFMLAAAAAIASIYARL